MIQTASIEKNHSAALAWFFSAHNNSIGDTTKKNIISSLIDPKIEGQFEIKGQFEYVFLEYKNIDLIIEYEDSVFAIENKIKISEHNHQLTKYSEILQNDERFNGKKVYKLFLTLIGEKPTDQDWLPISYEDVLNALKEITTKNDILIDYLDNLNKLVNSKKEFMENHQNFPNVFKDGGQKKYQKKLPESASPSAKYISENGLETIFQKAFLSKLAKELKFDCEHLIIGETRGTALIDFKNPFCCRTFNIEGVNIDIGLQIQGSTIKVQFENGLNDDGKRKPKTKAFRIILEQHIPKLYDQFNLKKSGWKLNRPKSRTSNYISFSRPMLFEGKALLYKDLSFDDTVIAVKHAIEDSVNILEKIRYFQP